MALNAYIDHTLLKPTATEGEIISLCNDAIIYNFHTVCVNSSYVPIAKQALSHTPVKVCTVVGFPLGAMLTDAKVYEAKKAINEGAEEIDMVINLGLLKSKNYVGAYKDIADVKSAIGLKTLKVIIEISELSKNEIVKACEICVDAKADFVKTSTGFAKSGATITAVKIIKKTLKGRAKIKASGGISDRDTAYKYLEVGVDRIGTSTGVAMVSDNLSVA